jgi:hypothetical protein
MHCLSRNGHIIEFRKSPMLTGRYDWLCPIEIVSMM